MLQKYTDYDDDARSLQLGCGVEVEVRNAAIAIQDITDRPLNSIGLDRVFLPLFIAIFTET